MFNEAENFDKDIGDWNTENVTDMSFMFWGAWAFDQDISRWITSSVTNGIYMFNDHSPMNSKKKPHIPIYDK
jgi:surface protein